jgi:hypothetical protein
MNYQEDCYAEIKNNTYDFTHPVIDPPLTQQQVTEKINSPEYLRLVIRNSGGFTNVSI